MGHVQAHTRAINNPTPQPKPKEEDWTVVPGIVGPNGEPIQQEKNSGQMRVTPLPGASVADKRTPPETRTITRVIKGVPHAVLVNSRTGEDIKDLRQTKLPGESPEQKRSAAESAQVERQSRVAVRKAEKDYRSAQATVAMQRQLIHDAKGGNKAAIEVANEPADRQEISAATNKRDSDSEFTSAQACMCRLHSAWQHDAEYSEAGCWPTVIN